MLLPPMLLFLSSSSPSSASININACFLIIRSSRQSFSYMGPWRTRFCFCWARRNKFFVLSFNLLVSVICMKKFRCCWLYLLETRKAYLLEFQKADLAFENVWTNNWEKLSIWGRPSMYSRAFFARLCRFPQSRNTDTFPNHFFLLRELKFHMRKVWLLFTEGFGHCFFTWTNQTFNSYLPFCMHYWSQ